ncbi:transcriptional elongation factor [Nile crocodilepox virus]|uniref:Late transcription elongation factor OPG087 n=1 Tax=Nile crocodilepox virus (isolate Crocodylus niloticus/Zimbabwe/Ume/2001) TaxID=1289473 RepID=Q070H7_CPRVZ|nr:transcriptional elongation factor [Nile crocodilepox virus]ABJ08965.1 transcriptional elongation factor [Nile crocodilepox virus]
MEFGLFHLAKFLLTEDEEALRQFNGVCAYLQRPKHEVLKDFYCARQSRRITRALNCADVPAEVALEFPPDLARQLVGLRLRGFRCVVRRSAWLPADAAGEALVAADGRVYHRRCNPAMLAFVRRRYRRLGREFAEAGDALPAEPGGLAIVCGRADVSLYEWICRDALRTNVDAEVVVTEGCIEKVLSNTKLTSKLLATHHRRNAVHRSLKTIYDRYAESIAATSSGIETESVP